MTTEREASNGFFSLVDRFLADGRADEAEQALADANRVISAMFGVPALVKDIEILKLRGDYQGVVTRCETFFELAAGSPHRGRAAALHAEALRQLGRPDDAEKVIERNVAELCNDCLRLSLAGRFAEAKLVLNAAMTLDRKFAERFANANPKCWGCVNRTN